MYAKPVGVSILTNAARLGYLKACVDSLLRNCHYRPFVVGIFDNGSTDGTRLWMGCLPKTYGVEWRVAGSPTDLGCAAGTNRACELVRDCEFALHLESDFEHLPQEATGEDKLWLRRAVEFADKESANYIYLRRMVDERDLAMHWWSQWMERVDGADGRYLRCPDFWWSNNPHLRRNAALYAGGTLPLAESLDGAKGTPGWSKPEMSATKPGKAWIHRWGVFVHERQSHGDKLGLRGCVPEGCKYGLFKDGTGGFCGVCDRTKGFEDMRRHEDRFGGRSG